MRLRPENSWVGLPVRLKKVIGFGHFEQVAWLILRTF